MQEATVSTALHGSQAARPDPSLDGVEFAVYTVLIAGLWYVMHLLRGDAGLGPRSWVPDLGLDTGALLLCVLWTICVAWRLRNVGLPSLAVDFCLFILATSLLPLALGVISFPVSLLIFAVLQIPAVFMRRKTMPTRDLSVQADS
jgi:hypothetical protein